jgi:three-Cys-motif partner protein
VNQAEKKTGFLFDVGKPDLASSKQVARPRHPVWTRQKALLIKRYMQLFVMVTKSGSYIDAFAGPQYPDKPEMWAAKLVLENRPKLLRHFYLFETDPVKYALLEELVAVQDRPYGRTIEPSDVDSNVGIRELLTRGVIKDKEPTFALLDQHTRDCDWATVKALAEHKRSGHKIELFYFLANGWLVRSLANTRDDAALERWWGGSDWRDLIEMRADDRGKWLARRFEQELGYRSAIPYAIYESDDSGGQVMYFMVHATDHEKAPELMTRAYRNVHKAERKWEEEQRPLLGSSSMLLSDATGKYRAKCGRCSDESAPTSGTVAAVVEHVSALGWTPLLETEWLCPTCQGKPLGPKRRPRKLTAFPDRPRARRTRSSS